MRKFRRANKSHDHITSHIVRRDPTAIQPPKKVISALRSFQAPYGRTEYLSFEAGDFFHVVARENDQDVFEVEGLGGARGIVPRSYFEEVGKADLRSKGSHDNESNDTHDSGFSEGQDSSRLSTRSSVGGAEAAEAARKKSMSSTRSGNKAGVLIYAIVAYDFKSERPDELQAEAGEKLIIIAQSNPEWFVAKPIQRLGGPGLIPVSYVTVRYTSDDREVENPVEAVKAAGIPRVEEWKQRAAWYRNNSVPLGKLEIHSTTSQQSLPSATASRMSVTTGNSGRSQDTFRDPRHSSYSQASSSPAIPGLRSPVNAHVAGYSHDHESRTFFFRVELNTDDGRAWALRRTYNDFFDLCMRLQHDFPIEAGKGSSQQRIIPYLPGPVPVVTLELTRQRLPHLDKFLRDLMALPAYITRSNVSKLFFGLREGDEEIEPFDLPEPSWLQPQQYEQQQQMFMQPDSATQSTQSFASATTANGQDYGSPSRSQAQQYGHRPPDAYGQNGGGHYRSNSAVPNGGIPNGLPYHLQRNDSQVTNNSGTSLNNNNYSQAQPPPPPSGPPPGGVIIVKVKVFLADNCIILRIPQGFTYAELVAKLKERYSLEPDIDKPAAQEIDFLIEFKDEQQAQFYRMEDDEGLELARSRNEKLTLKVTPMSH